MIHLCVLSDSEMNASEETTPKTRLQITLSEDAIAKAKAMAKQERRSFSNLLEVLIDRAEMPTSCPPEPEAAGCQCNK